MNDQRTAEDRLREEYFELLPDIRRVAEELEAEVKYAVLPICRRLNGYEQLVVTSRVKECDSALESLRRRQEGGTFDKDRPEIYTLTRLNDLAGVRVLAFPRSRLPEIDEQLRKRFASWAPDPVPGFTENLQPLALKYHGYCQASNEIRGEYQIASVLIGLFWEVEHSAIYKPTPHLKGIADSLEMKQHATEVYYALNEFEEAFEAQIQSEAAHEQ